jgi:hypothetical protein
MLFRSSSDFEILRRADAELFVRMIDQLQHPTLVKQCLTSEGLLASPRGALNLLWLANLSFDAEGRWQRSGMAAILLLQLMSENLLSPRFEEEGTDDMSKGIAQFGSTVVGLVELAWHWLENLLRQTPSVPPPGEKRPAQADYQSHRDFGAST